MKSRLDSSRATGTRASGALMYGNVPVACGPGGTRRGASCGDVSFPPMGLRFLPVAVVLAAVIGVSSAHASGPAGGGGTNPFSCTLQQLGMGTEFPQPDADPFCVEYDKTHQNATELGVVQFLSKEPARVAAASDKCFYFQRDHWTGSVVQGRQPETYHWDGSYYFDKLRGTGGVYVEN